MFNQTVIGCQLPSLLEELIFGDGFNRPLEDFEFPPQLKMLKFGYLFNQPVERCRFPSSLEDITFGTEFNQPIMGLNMPESMRNLRFGLRFNQPVEDYIFPQKLEFLSFGRKFNQSISRIRLPDTLLHFHLCLSTGYKFRQPIYDVCWPNSLIELHLPIFPGTTKTLQFPPNLQTLKINIQDAEAQLFFPPKLERLSFAFGSLLLNPPPSVHTLSYGAMPNYTFPLPVSCKQLIFFPFPNEAVSSLIARPDFPKDCQKIIAGRKNWGQNGRVHYVKMNLSDDIPQ